MNQFNKTVAWNPKMAASEVCTSGLKEIKWYNISCSLLSWGSLNFSPCDLMSWIFTTVYVHSSSANATVIKNLDVLWSMHPRIYGLFKPVASLEVFILNENESD